MLPLQARGDLTSGWGTTSTSEMCCTSVKKNSESKKKKKSKATKDITMRRNVNINYVLNIIIN